MGLWRCFGRRWTGKLARMADDGCSAGRNASSISSHLSISQRQRSILMPMYDFTCAQNQQTLRNGIPDGSLRHILGETIYSKARKREKTNMTKHLKCSMTKSEGVSRLLWTTIMAVRQLTNTVIFHACLTLIGSGFGNESITKVNKSFVNDLSRGFCNLNSIWRRAIVTA